MAKPFFLLSTVVNIYQGTVVDICFYEVVFGDIYESIKDVMIIPEKINIGVNSIYSFFSTNSSYE